MTLRIAVTARLLVDNDWAGDPDGLVALAHHLLSPSDEVIGVTSSSLSPEFGPAEGTASRGEELARELISRVVQDRDIPVAAGADAPFDGSGRETAAARLIVDTALDAFFDPAFGAASTGGERLTLVCGGPLTNVADALRLEPRIADRIDLLWVGGTLEAAVLGDDFEYNRDCDRAAAEFVLTAVGLHVTRFPAETYRQLAISVAELEYRLTSSGDLGRWLWERYERLPLPEGLSIDPVWPLGDSAPLAVTALRHSRARFRDGVAPGHRVCTDLDHRLIIEDFFARLHLHSESS